MCQASLSHAIYLCYLSHPESNHIQELWAMHCLLHFDLRSLGATGNTPSELPFIRVTVHKVRCSLLHRICRHCPGTCSKRRPSPQLTCRNISAAAPTTECGHSNSQLHVLALCVGGNRNHLTRLCELDHKTQITYWSALLIVSAQSVSSCHHYPFCTDALHLFIGAGTRAHWAAILDKQTLTSFKRL